MKELDMKTEDDNPIYLDAASTTKVDPRVFEAMTPYFLEYFGNASSQHTLGEISKKAIEKARENVSKLINCFSDEIIFTSGATESINLALKGYVEAHQDKGRNHLITVKTEHKAVLNTCEYLESKGIEITYLDVDENGLINLENLKSAIKDTTLLVSVMYVNNETGIIQPIKNIGKICSENNVIFFCDATQAVGKIKVDVIADDIDMLCFSGHKLNGPKGVGVLYKKDSVALIPLIHGGGQENGLRAGTYNTPLIVGLGKACDLAQKEFSLNNKRFLSEKERLGDYFKARNIGEVNFKKTDTAPHILSITLNNIEAGEFLMTNSKQIMASTGSACNSSVLEFSHVLKSMGLNKLENIIRISIPL